ncbi:hypothetical protein K438DRAFT_1757295 [Mycena galopus ATCC 62051]|nr:hypothetical protein K438DRAFT_1757295 [Mycena galopus ATCC 62051]
MADRGDRTRQCCRGLPTSEIGFAELVSKVGHRAPRRDGPAGFPTIKQLFKERGRVFMIGSRDNDSSVYLPPVSEHSEPLRCYPGLSIPDESNKLLPYSQVPTFQMLMLHEAAVLHPLVSIAVMKDFRSHTWLDKWRHEKPKRHRTELMRRKRKARGFEERRLSQLLKMTAGRVPSHSFGAEREPASRFQINTTAKKLSVDSSSNPHWLRNSTVGRNEPVFAQHWSYST